MVGPHQVAVDLTAPRLKPGRGERGFVPNIGKDVVPMRRDKTRFGGVSREARA